MFVDDYKSMEWNNDIYFKENKKFQVQVVVWDQYIIDFRKGISVCDKIIDSMQGLIMDIVVFQLNVDFEVELECFINQMEEFKDDIYEKDSYFNDREICICMLKDENMEIFIDNECFKDENWCLWEEQKEIEDQWVDEW